MEGKEENVEFEKKIIDKVIDFTCRHFPEEIEKARKDYMKTHAEIIKIAKSDTDIERDFQAWFLLEYPLPSSYTPMEFAYLSKEEFSGDEKMMVNNFLNYVVSLFEIKNISENCKDYTIVNFINNKEYLVKTIELAPALKVGDVISAKIVKKPNDNYFFYGNIASYTKKSAEKIKKEFLTEMKRAGKNKIEKEVENLGKEAVEDRGKLLEAQKEMVNSFREYFGCDEVIFEEISELESKFNAFLKWRNKSWIVPGKGKTPEQLWEEEGNSKMELSKISLKASFSIGMKKFGLVTHPKCGVIIVPYYGYVKQLFEGDYTSIPDYHGFLYGVIAENSSIVPSFIIKKLVNENKERTLELFKDAYKNVESIEDVYEIFERFREDWNQEPEVGMALVS